MEHHESILKLLKHIHDNVEQKLNAILKSQDLTLSQGHILKFLHYQENYQSNFKEIEKYLDIAQSTTVGLVSRLEKKNFVETFTDPSDKRVKIVKLTPTGLNIIGYSQTSMDQFEKEMVSNLSEIELSLFAELLRKVNSSFKKQSIAYY